MLFGDNWTRVTLGEFRAEDYVSLQPPGVWIFRYTIRARHNNAVSDFKFSGDIYLSCLDPSRF